MVVESKIINELCSLNIFQIGWLLTLMQSKTQEIKALGGTGASLTCHQPWLSEYSLSWQEMNSVGHCLPPYRNPGLLWWSPPFNFPRSDEIRLDWPIQVRAKLSTITKKRSSSSKGYEERDPIKQTFQSAYFHMYQISIWKTNLFN